MSTGVHTSLSLLVFSVHISSSGITRSYGRSIFSFLRNEVDETRAYYTEWNKSERKTPIIYMEFRKMVMMTLYVRQQKRHRCKEQTSGLCGRRRGWDDLREYHWNMYMAICETDRQSKFDAWNRALKAGALGQPWGMGWEGCGREIQDGEHMYTHGWFMSMYGKNYHSIVK